MTGKQMNSKPQSEGALLTFVWIKFSPIFSSRFDCRWEKLRGKKQEGAVSSAKVQSSIFGCTGSIYGNFIKLTENIPFKDLQINTRI